MNSTLVATRHSAKESPRERFYIDGFSVSDLFDIVYDETRDMADRFKKPIRFDIISWSPLTVAADAEAFSDALAQAVRWCLASEDTHCVTIRSYPCHDDVWAVFDIQADLYADKQQSPEAWKPTLCELRTAIQKMGGEWEPVASYKDCRRITFRLPQWVMADAEIPQRLRQAS